MDIGYANNVDGYYVRFVDGNHAGFMVYQNCKRTKKKWTADQWQ